MRSSLKRSVNQQGFTLIELVVVIVILGILAVTAAPKFIDISNEAKVATVEGAAGALRSARDLAYARNAVGGTASYPSSGGINAEINIDGFTESPAGTFLLDGEADCFAKYADSVSGASPVVSTETSGCS
jgi:MSHA pilin protein MshA